MKQGCEVAGAGKHAMHNFFQFVSADKLDIFAFSLLANNFFVSSSITWLSCSAARAILAFGGIVLLQITLEFKNQLLFRDIAIHLRKQQPKGIWQKILIIVKPGKVVHNKGQYFFHLGRK